MTDFMSFRAIAIWLTLIVCSLLLSCDIEKENWEKARISDSIEQINQYLADYPDTENRERALAIIDSLNFVQPIKEYFTDLKAIELKGKVLITMRDINYTPENGLPPEETFLDTDDMLYPFLIGTDAEGNAISRHWFGLGLPVGKNALAYGYIAKPVKDKILKNFSERTDSLVSAYRKIYSNLSKSTQKIVDSLNQKYISVPEKLKLAEMQDLRELSGDQSVAFRSDSSFLVAVFEAERRVEYYQKFHQASADFGSTKEINGKPISDDFLIITRLDSLVSDN